MTSNQFWEIIAFFGTIVVFIPIFYKLKVNPLLAFICAGVVLGPHMLGLIRDVKVADDIGELGLLFLMFSIGLDLSFRRFKIMRFYIFGYGLAQFFITAFVFGAVSFLLGKTVHECIIIGSGLAMSSTAVASRLMRSMGKMHAPSGRASIGILLLQDLSIIPLMLLLPRLATADTTLGADIGDMMLKSVGAVTLIIVIGRMLMKPLFRAVVDTQSSEAFTALIFLVFLGTAWTTNLAGLSISLGAFLGGMLIAETDFVHEVEAEISSISSLLLGVFFLSVGMMVDVEYALSHIPQILLLTVLVMTAKFIITYFIERKLGLSHEGAVTSAVFLCQAGEFGFIIFNMASANFGLLSQKTANQLQVVIALSMVLTPFVSNFVLRRFGEWSRNMDKKNGSQASDEVVLDENMPQDHVVLIGYSDVGQTAARLMVRNGIRFFVVDDKLASIEKAQKNNRPCLFGNASKERILRATNIEGAKAVVITMKDAVVALHILKMVRQISALVPVFVRCDDVTHWAEFTTAGATGIISQSQECGIRMGLATILALGGKEQEIRDAASVMRQENTINVQLPTA